MYCRNCGTQIDAKAPYCNGCGCIPGEGVKFCPNCGKETDALAAACVSCKFIFPKKRQSKSKLAAGLLGLFLGSLGVHNFYLGYKSKALWQLLLTLLGCGIGAIISAVWGFVEGVMIISGSIDKDADGNPLKE